MAGLVGDTGPIDYDALVRIRDVFLKTEPLVSHHSLDGRLDSRPELTVTVDAGFGSSPCGRFDIVWTERDCSNFHYIGDSGLEFRFDWHPEPNAPSKHFHEPPGAVSRARSCINIEPPELVTRAVLRCWRTALSEDDPSKINSVANSP